MIHPEFQKKCLEYMREVYPAEVDGDEFFITRDEVLPLEGNVTFEVEFDRLTNPQFILANLQYLEEHGLIETRRANLNQPVPNAKITADGLDFLTEDGGLGAILNTVTVKFDADNIRELLAEGLLQADMSEDKKGIIRTALEGATTDTIKDLAGAVLRNPVKAIETAATVLGITL